MTVIAPALPVPGGLARRQRPARRALLALAPSVVVATAYVDPGNIATNVTAGSRYGYALLWVLVAANVTAVLVQYLSAKLGTATGSGLAALCRQRCTRPVRLALWAQAELVAMATDVAEFVGAAIALHLLLGLGPMASAGLTAAVSFAVLGLRRHGRHRFETTVGVMIAVLALGFGWTALASSPEPGALAGGMVPGLAGDGSLLLACGIVGATVMPHAVYLHSDVAAAMAPAAGAGRTAPALLAALRTHRRGLLVALTFAGLVNAAILVAAAAALHGGQVTQTVEAAHAGFGAALGPATALLFALALLASGLSSSAVGTLAGEGIMRGFTGWTVSPLLRRTVTMAPAVLVLGAGVDSTQALVVSQVVLCCGLPFTLVPLVWWTARRSVMGPLVNRWTTTAAAAGVTAVVVGLSGLLVVAGG